MNFPSQIFLNDINHGCRAAILRKNYLWLPPFYMAVATYCYYEKVRRTMRAAIVSYLLKEYLQNRKQLVTIENLISDTLPINCGSVLRPLLFLIYIHDLHNAVKHTKIHHFADNTNFLYYNNSLKDINKKNP